MLDRRTLPLYALRAFESAGKHLHMGLAGEELGVTHGAISHQVRSLEEQLAVKLFDRVGNRIRLTDSGQRLLIAVQSGFETILEGTIHLDPNTLAGDLVVGFTQTAGVSWVAKQLCEFSLRYPQVDVRTVEIRPQQKSIPRDIDIAICYGKPNYEGRRLQALSSPPIFPVCSPKLLNGKKKVSRASHLTQFPLLYDSQNSWDRWFSEFDVDLPNEIKQLQFFSTNLTISAARAGYGVALCNLFEVQDDLKEGRLIQLLDRTISETQSYYLVADLSDKQLLRARLFEEWIIDALT